LALTWSDNHQGRLDFPFPQLIIIIYQRGTLPTVVQTIKLDYLFFRNWLDGQSFRFDAGLIAEQQRLEEIAQLHEILETALREERVHYEEEIRRRQSSAEDWRAKLEKGKPSQPNLF
jgi:ribosome recycling factor